MEWLFPSVVATLVGSLIMVFIYGFLYFQERETHVGIWAASWLVYSLRFAFLLWSLTVPQSILLPIASQVCTMISGVMLIWGTLDFLGKPISRWWAIALIAGIAWIFTTAFLKLPFLVQTIPTFTFLSIAYIWVGIILLRAQQLASGSRSITGWALIVWGIHKANYPFLRPVVWFAPWGYLLGATFGITVALGMLLVYFQKNKEDLQNSEARWRSLTQNSPDYVVTVGRDLTIEFANAASPGLTVDELIGQPLYTFVEEERQPEIKAIHEQVISTGQPTTYETVYHTPGGRTIIYESLAVPRIVNGQIIGLTVSARDVTEHKRIQAELVEYREHLEERVAARTYELEKANEELTRLAEIKTEFVSNVSHELRTPIASIKLYHHILDLKPEKRDRYMQTLKRETTRLENIIENLLRIARLDQNPESLSLLPVDLNALVQIYTTDRSMTLKEAGLTLDVDPAPALPQVQADAKQLGDVLSILLTNAQYYTPEGGRVMVRTGTSQKDGQEWAGFEVQDNGLGISPEEQAHLFERFFRGKAGRETNTPGTGLGLAIACEIVRQHQGRIEVQSTGIPGQGTTFSVWLPVE